MTASPLISSPQLPPGFNLGSPMQQNTSATSDNAPPSPDFFALPKAQPANQDKASFSTSQLPGMPPKASNNAPPSPDFVVLPKGQPLSNDKTAFSTSPLPGIAGGSIDPSLKMPPGLANPNSNSLDKSLLPVGSAPNGFMFPEVTVQGPDPAKNNVSYSWKALTLYAAAIVGLALGVMHFWPKLRVGKVKPSEPAPSTPQQ